MRVLLTRPEPDATATAGRLSERGHTVHHAPLLSVHLKAEPALTEAPGGIVVTSRNAVRALATWRSSGKWHDLPLFAVGDASADLARAHGFADVRSAGGNVGALRALVRRTADPHAGPLLYPAARQPAADLAGDLQADGFSVMAVEAYHTEPAKRLDPVAEALLQDGKLDAMVVFSPRGGAVLRALLTAAGLSERLGDVHVVAISAAAGAPLADLSVAGLHVAARPDEKSVLALVDSLSQRL
ncbi:MAG: uroporphyrinogen-III synthase [Alphaproteobacteria bacterium]